MQPVHRLYNPTMIDRAEMEGVHLPLEVDRVADQVLPIVLLR